MGLGKTNPKTAAKPKPMPDRLVKIMRENAGRMIILRQSVQGFIYPLPKATRGGILGETQ